MSKEEQILNIDPQHELKFVGTFLYPITSYIKLTNPSISRVGFKIKTTAPKKYCVRPNSGILEPKKSIDIAVSLQAFDFDVAEKNKHKFMVQTMFVPEGDVNLESLWKHVKEETLMGTKLKCVFERTESAGTGSASNETTTSVQQSTTAAPPNHDDNAKRIGDSPSVHKEGELVKAAKEVKLLREEESALRHENLQLKEEIIRLRHVCESSKQSGSQLSANLPPAPAAMPMMLVVAIIVGMIGIVLGKFML